MATNHSSHHPKPRSLYAKDKNSGDQASMAGNWSSRLGKAKQIR